MFVALCFVFVFIRGFVSFACCVCLCVCVRGCFVFDCVFLCVLIWSFECVPGMLCVCRFFHFYVRFAICLIVCMCSWHCCLVLLLLFVSLFFSVCVFFLL